MLIHVLIHVCYMCVHSTFREEVSDVQLQRGNDLIKHLEFLSKTRHLEDEAGRHLQLWDSKMKRSNRMHTSKLNPGIETFCRDCLIEPSTGQAGLREKGQDNQPMKGKASDEHISWAKRWRKHVFYINITDLFQVDIAIRSKNFGTETNSLTRLSIESQFEMHD